MPEPENLATTGNGPHLSVPALPAIVSEWAAIVPLVSHLASPRDEYMTAGDISLLGRLPIDCFSRLGTLFSLGLLVDGEGEFLDYAGTGCGTSRTAWDVRWGSVFPVANGAASASIVKCAMARQKPALQDFPIHGQSVPEEPVGDRLEEQPMSTSVSAPSSTNRQNFSAAGKSCAPGFRPQILSVLDFQRTQRRLSVPQRLRQWRFSRPCRVLSSLLGLGLSIGLCFIGAYGTASITAVYFISEAVAAALRIHRPANYLTNNETHDAYMLVAPHKNATEWHLYIGDRGVVDTILNKPMILIPQCAGVLLAGRWFKFAHLVQLTSMTFVASRKGWDGICLVALLALHLGLSWVFRSQNLAGDWLDSEGVAVNVKTYRCTGRFVMMGAVQVFSGTDITSWMDEILVPHPRREAWLKLLRQDPLSENLSEHDMKIIKMSSEASLAAAKVLADDFRPGAVAVCGQRDVC